MLASLAVLILAYLVLSSDISFACTILDTSINVVYWLGPKERVVRQLNACGQNYCTAEFQVSLRAQSG